MHWTLCRRCVLFLLLALNVGSQGPAVITLSASSVYCEDQVTLTCDYGRGMILSIVTIDAFNGTLREGYLWCSVSQRNATGSGVLAKESFTGCPGLPTGPTFSVSVTMTASLAFELDYNCTAIVFDGVTSYYTVTSSFTRLTVLVRPAVPRFMPRPLTFTDHAIVQCESLDAKPAAIVKLTVRSTKGSELTSTGSESTSLMLSPPLMNWNNATAMCIVLNHNFSNMTTTSSIAIHRSAWLTVSSNPVYSGEPVHLTCNYNTADTLFAATINAFNGTQKEGSLSVSRIGAGVIEGKIFEEYSSSFTSSSVTLLVKASPLLELDFNCTVTVILDDRSLLELTSATVSLMVHVLPDVPKLLPSSLVFQVAGSAIVACESRNGKPAAVINLTISAPSGNLLTAVGTEYVLLNLTVPVDWHNAKASCTVMNHLFPNFSATSAVMINHGSLSCENCWIFGPIVGGITFAVIIIVGLLYKLGHFSFRRKRKFSGRVPSQKQTMADNPQDSSVRDVMLPREDNGDSSSDRKPAPAEMPYATLFAETKCDTVAYESLLFYLLSAPSRPLKVVGGPGADEGKLRAPRMSYLRRAGCFLVVYGTLMPRL